MCVLQSSTFKYDDIKTTLYSGGLTDKNMQDAWDFLDFLIFLKTTVQWKFHLDKLCPIWLHFYVFHGLNPTSLWNIYLMTVQLMKNQSCIFQPYSHDTELTLPLLLFVSPLFTKWRKIGWKIGRACLIYLGSKPLTFLYYNAEVYIYMRFQYIAIIFICPYE